MDYNPASPFVMQSKIKRVCIIGVGAVGGFLAAKIATSPQDLIISLVVRPKYAKTLREEGLIVLSGNQKISTKNFGVYESTSKVALGLFAQLC
jgi:ketopantoate reductase